MQCIGKSASYLLYISSRKDRGIFAYKKEERGDCTTFSYLETLVPKRCPNPLSIVKIVPGSRAITEGMAKVLAPPKG